MSAPSYKNERDVKRDIKKILDAYGWFWFSPPANAYGMNGIADVLALRAGVFLAIEAKFGKNRTSALQQAFLQTVAAESGFGFVVSDKTLPQFAEWMVLFDKSCKAAETGQPVADEDGAAMLNCMAVLTEPVVAERKRAA